LARLISGLWRVKMFSNDEREFLKELVKRELEHFRKDEKTAGMDAALKFLKAEHEYGHFLENLLAKIK